MLGLIGRFGFVEKTHMGVLVFHLPPNPILSLALADHPKARVVDRKRSRALALNDYLDAPAALADGDDRSLTIRHGNTSFCGTHLPVFAGARKMPNAPGLATSS
jgi:hypothetical protein